MPDNQNMVAFDQARELINNEARSFGRDKIDLENAVGRVLAEPIVADRDYPPFNRAAMDGYAIKLADWDAGVRAFQIREKIFAGATHTTQIMTGECYQIMTGASVPESADVVIRREDVTERADSIECKEVEVREFQNVALRGADLRKGEKIFYQSMSCTPSVVAVLAAIGKTELEVERLPSVSIITTGDEVVDILSSVNEVQIRNSNSYLIRALLKKWNITQISTLHVPDKAATIYSALRSVTNCDIIILCGGVSAGDADFVPSTLATAGASKIFHKVAIKPGKPLWFGKFPGGSTVFALPGNPLSCLVTFKLFIEFFLYSSFSLVPMPTFNLPLLDRRIKKSNLDEFFPVRITGPQSSCQIIPFNGSGDITTALHAHGIARHPREQDELKAGTIVEVYSLL